MVTPRERVLKACAFEETARVPMDLAGMASTSISCFAYPSLVKALGLAPRPPRVYDTGQMLALPDKDVLDALGCDVVALYTDMTNAFDQPELWRPYDFNGRLQATVRWPETFEALPDGAIVQNGNSRMAPNGHVFDTDHGGQPLDFTADLPKPDLAAVKAALEKQRPTPQARRALIDFCRKARQATDRAILFNGPRPDIGIAAHLGIGIFPMLCLAEPDYVHELHAMQLAYGLETLEMILPEIADCIDIYMCNSDDWGTQSATIASPRVYRDLFQPYYRRFNEAIHALAPNVKTFFHSCGAIYDIIDDIAESGYDILNPVQWTAGGHGFREWKDKARGKIVLWGGGVNTQSTLPLGTVEEVERETAEVVDYMKQGGGFVFCAIHNILAEIPGEKVVAMYRAAAAR